MAISDAPGRAAQGSMGRWLQLGMLSATVTAPLIARWRGLRDDDRAQALRERAETLRERAAARLAGVAGPRTGAATDADAARHRAVRASLWLAGASAGLIAAGVITYVVIRNRAQTSAGHEALAEIPADHLASEPLPTPPAGGEPPIAEASPSQEPGLAPPPVFSDADAEGAGWVGDIYTRAYTPLQDIDDTALPAQDRRIYFATEEQAIAAGYHRADAAPDARG